MKDLKCIYWYENKKLRLKCPNCYIEIENNELDNCDCCGYNLRKAMEKQ